MNKNKKILNYWNKRSKNKLLKCTNDKLLEKNELKFLKSFIKKKSVILDIGCGEGTLLKYLRKNRNVKGIGLDYSSDLIKIAKKNSKNLEFICWDMKKIDKISFKLKNFDYIITKRSLQNLTSWKIQKKFINMLHKFSSKKTKIILIESSKNSLTKINIFRKKLKLSKINMPWHNLYLDDNKIINSKFKKIKLKKIHEIFSTYYFISRIINAANSKQLKKKPSYNDKLNLIGWKLPQNLTKGFSQLKIYEFKKN